jgi:hypothetical protein
MTISQEAIVIFDPNTGNTTRYETYFPDRSEHYSQAACERLRAFEEEMSEEEYTTPNSSSEMDMRTSIDSDDWEDETVNVSSGVRDVLLTGKVMQRSFHVSGSNVAISALTVCSCRQLNATVKHGDILTTSVELGLGMA